MIATVLEQAGLDPSYLIGGDLNESGSGARAGEGDLFLFEADESDGSFLLTDPAVGVVTNVEVDHVDFYPGGEDELRTAFAEFCARSGRVVACTDDDGAREALRLAGVEPIGYGIGHGRGGASGGRVPGAGWSPGDARRSTGTTCRWRFASTAPTTCWMRPRRSRWAASSACPRSTRPSHSRSFDGIRRRFEHRGSARGAEFYDDYAHVPHGARA